MIFHPVWGGSATMVALRMRKGAPRIGLGHNAVTTQRHRLQGQIHE